MHRCPTPLLRRIRTRASRGLRPPAFWHSFALAILAALVLCSSAGATGPEISFSLTGTQGDNGWYRSSVGIVWVVNGGMALSGCQSTTLLADTPGSTQECTASDGAITKSTSVTIRIDKTPPTVTTATPERAPDANGWFNHPVSFSFSGTDAGSGIAGCSQVSYAGPDNQNAAVTGTCQDKAGNEGSATFPLRYDATPPTLGKVTVTSGTAADVLRWSSSSPSDTVVVQRRARDTKTEATVFRGSGRSFTDKGARGGLEYVYSVQAFDQADNASKAISAVALPRVLTLRKTPYVPRAAQDPILRWEAAPGASYYHVQLFRAGKRILAAWPNRPELGLPATWKWAGHRYRLAPGLYRWYVWAGLGRRSFARYRTIGTGRFVVPQR
ncbi:MAG: hypothetical protein WBB76_04365 [Gaiellaceae bacterium]